MTAQKTSLFNAFETQLSASVGAADLTFNVDATAPLTSPCYLVIDPTSASKREYVLFDGTFTSTAFVTSSTANRGLGGSAAGAQSHAAGTTVRCVPMHQHFDDLNDRVDNVLNGTSDFTGTVDMATVNIDILLVKGPVHDVTHPDYGADKTGSLGASAAVNAAITAASVGDTIYFPRGTYTGDAVINVSKSVTVLFADGVTFNGTVADPGIASGLFNITANDVTLEGSGWRSLITQGVAENIQNLVYLNAVARFTLRNMKVDANDVNQTNAAGWFTGVRSSASCSAVTIERCWFTRGGNRAIDVRGSDDIEITGCRFTDTGVTTPGGTGGNAVSVDRTGATVCSNVRVLNNFFERFGDAAIGVVHCKRATVTGNVIVGAVVNGATAVSTESGISVNGCEDTAVIGNTVRKVLNVGITAISKDDGTNQWPIRNIQIVGNTCVGQRGATNYDSHIIVTQSHAHGDDLNAVTVQGNTLVDTEISVGGDYTRGVAVVGNVVRGSTSPGPTGLVGIKFHQSGPDHYSIVGNIVRNMPTGIQTQVNVGSNGVIFGNTVVGATTQYSIANSPGPVRGLGVGTNDIARAVGGDTSLYREAFNSLATSGKLRIEGDAEVDGALDHDGTTVGFYGVAPAARPTALTAADAATVDATYGTEEAGVINNLRTRVNELETKLRSLGLLS